MLYGFELLYLPRSALDILEQAHFSIGRSFQGLPRTSPINVAVLPSLGWLCTTSGHAWADPALIRGGGGGGHK